MEAKDELGKKVTIKKRKECAKGTKRNRKGECAPIQAEKKDEIIMEAKDELGKKVTIKKKKRMCKRNKT